MEEDIRFLTELYRIINGALRLDLDRVRNYTLFLANKLEGEGHIESGNRLRKLLEETKGELRPATIASRSLPVDPESRFPLMERVDLSADRQVPIVLSEHQRQTVFEFLSTVNSRAQLEEAGMGSSLAILLYGPPGCGKSKLARYMAEQLGLELLLVRLDGLVSSFLGSTAKNIRAVFDYASSTPCVLFLDELDAIAKVRSDSQELGELKRVVNSFIQNLDSLGHESIVVAATNHSGLLDPAIWRRFPYRLELGLPDSPMRMEMWNTFLRPGRLTQKEIEILVDMSEGFSGSDIREVCQRVTRRWIAMGESPTLRGAFDALLSLSDGHNSGQRFLSTLRSADTTSQATALRQRNPRLYSHSLIGRLFGISKSKAHRLSRTGGTA